MSMHKITLTPVEEAGLKAHGLDIGTPSQLSDAFRQGVAWGEQGKEEMHRLINLYEEDLTLLLQLFANEMGSTERTTLRKRLVELRMFQRKSSNV